MKIAQINSLRRDVLDKLRDTRMKNYPCMKVTFKANDTPYPVTSIDYRGNVLNSKAREFYLRHGVINIGDAAESGVDLHNCHVMRTRYCLRKEFNLCLKNGSPAKKLFLRDENYEILELKFDCENCEMNVIWRGRGWKIEESISDTFPNG